MFFSLIYFCNAQNGKSYAVFLDSANAIKYKDDKKADLYIQKAMKLASDKDLGDFYLKAIQIYIDINHFDEALEFCTKAHDVFTEKKI
ncbi:hypothetical protein [Chryseobacterium indoltheticum]|uniref:hypothetical protein n=1 Tax=Chryseobacterium indoltheticum TaxID=254 RepID=UPI003F492406